MDISPASQARAPEAYTRPPGFFKRLTVVDWLFGAGLLAAALFALQRYGAYMDIYEQAILVLAAPTFAFVGWTFKPVRWLMPLVALLALWPWRCTAARSMPPTRNSS